MTTTPGSLDLPLLTIAQVNTLPEASGRWWPMGLNDRIVAVLKAALSAQRQMDAVAFDAHLRSREAEGLALLREAYEALLDTPQTATVRLVRMKIRAAISKPRKV